MSTCWNADLWSALRPALLVITGVIAGWVNTVAGGGSLVAVPTLLWLGLPADVANGTSRVAILVQGATATFSFQRAGRLDAALLWPIALPSVSGALLGAYVATFIPNRIFQPILLGTLALMGLSMFLRPETAAAQAGQTTVPVAGNRKAQLTLFATGVYGGLLQAGVGILLLYAMGRFLRIDFARGNALKSAVIFLYTIAVVVIFAANAKIAWADGALLALGQMLGARLGVHFALSQSDRVVKRVLLVIIVGLCVALLLRT